MTAEIQSTCIGAPKAPDARTSRGFFLPSGGCQKRPVSLAQSSIRGTKVLCYYALSRFWQVRWDLLKKRQAPEAKAPETPPQSHAETNVRYHRHRTSTGGAAHTLLATLCARRGCPATPGNALRGACVLQGRGRGSGPAECDRRKYAKAPTGYQVKSAPVCEPSRRPDFEDARRA
jgi:hypothetical protein